MTLEWLRRIAYPRNKEYTQLLRVKIPFSLWDAEYSLKAEADNFGLSISFDEIITRAIRDFLVAGGVPIVVDTRKLTDIKSIDED
jgi:hypothetical protein